MYLNEPLKKYIDDLAARLPAPGGGSAAGLCGAIGIALLIIGAILALGKGR